MTALDRLGAEKYVLLTTFRKDGRAVATPVWVVRDGDALAVWSAADAGKVKRIRNIDAVTLAPCDFRGNQHADPVPAHASISDAAGSAHVRDLLKQKYGVAGRLTLLGSRLRRGDDGTVGIRIVLDD
ncbi:PPOX class F420-dependent oxidoreductase [Micromonospora sp. NPDC049679]|uniref:PPOX class F420-dependent oxidoreductase n=1 Tax=Micromonospora sp. NPDC049679 TaxID=3155920 RepID=UPI0033F3C611